MPIGDGPPSSRPFGLVLAPAIDVSGRLYLELVGFGERHPWPGRRSVYERAHKRLHGRYPDNDAADCGTEGHGLRIAGPHSDRAVG